MTDWTWWSTFIYTRFFSHFNKSIIENRSISSKGPRAELGQFKSLTAMSYNNTSCDTDLIFPDKPGLCNLYLFPRPLKISSISHSPLVIKEIAAEQLLICIDFKWRKGDRRHSFKSHQVQCMEAPGRFSINATNYRNSQNMSEGVSSIRR